MLEDYSENQIECFPAVPEELAASIGTESEIEIVFARCQVAGRSSCLKAGTTLTAAWLLAECLLERCRAPSTVTSPMARYWDSDADLRRQVSEMPDCGVGLLTCKDDHGVRGSGEISGRRKENGRCGAARGRTEWETQGVECKVEFGLPTASKGTRTSGRGNTRETHVTRSGSAIGVFGRQCHREVSGRRRG